MTDWPGPGVRGVTKPNHSRVSAPCGPWGPAGCGWVSQERGTEWETAVWRVLMQVFPEPPLVASSKGSSQAQPRLSGYRRPCQAPALPPSSFPRKGQPSPWPSWASGHRASVLHYSSPQTGSQRAPQLSPGLGRAPSLQHPPLPVQRDALRLWPWGLRCPQGLDLFSGLSPVELPSQGGAVRQGGARALDFS